MVDEGKGLIRRQMVMIANFKRTYPDASSEARTADYMMRLTEKDEQYMYLLSDEVDCAKTMMSLPSPKRLAYYQSNIPTIKNKELLVAKEFIAIAEAAKADGIVLPNLKSSEPNLPDSRP